MRAVKAKRLRQRARELSKGMPDRQLIVAREHKRKIIVGKNSYDVINREAVNDPKSTRGIYRALKKGTAA
jgi:hypothetical protein